MTTDPTAASSRRWLLPAIVLLGLALRGYHYLRCPSVWHDEAALLMNVLERTYTEQLGPLIWHEAAPPLFLWAERTMYLAFGDHLQVLRLLPFLASCGALLLLVPVSRRLLPAAAVPWAVLIFACGDKMAWHACEAKPYAVDAFVGACLLYLVATGDRHSLHRQLLLFTLLAPVMIFLSFPAVFLLGGLLVALLPAVRGERRRETWLRYGLLAVVVFVSFAVLALGPARAQRDGEMMSCWTNFFPDWSRPAWLPFWVAMATCEVLRYCFSPYGQLFIGFAIVGGVVFWRGGRRSLLAFLVVPVLLALAASCVRRYPYGGARVMLYGSAGLAVLVAAGVPASLAWLRRRHRLAPVLAIVILALPGLHSLQLLVEPWKRAETGPASAYVLEHRRPDDPVLANDWAHVYYLRRLRPLFQHFDDPDCSCRGSPRAWIVFTAQVPEPERLREAEATMPPGWRVLERAEFQFTTVLLAGDPKVH